MPVPEELASLELTEEDYATCMAHPLFSKVLDSVRIHLASHAGDAQLLAQVKAEHAAFVINQGRPSASFSRLKCVEQQFATLEKRLLSRETLLKQRGDLVSRLESDIANLGRLLVFFLF
jgi:hypothetical protein